MSRSVVRFFIHFTQGLAIGVANVIPGVSGGTMALIFGIYEKLILLLSELFKAALSLARLNFSDFSERLTSIQWTFLLSLTAGILVAPLFGAALIPGLLETWPEHSRSLFFGLILGTLPIPWIRIRDHSRRNGMILVIAALISFFLVGIPPAEISDPSLFAIFVAAVLAISAMMLPGVSGAFILLILGLYAPIFEAIDARNMMVILVFVLGAGIGLGGFAVLLKSLLARAHDSTMAALVGLMAGSLRALWPWLADDRTILAPREGEAMGMILLVGLLGFLVSAAMTAWEVIAKRKKSSIG